MAQKKYLSTSPTEALIMAANARADGAGFCDALFVPAHQHTPTYAVSARSLEYSVIVLAGCTADLSP